MACSLYKPYVLATRSLNKMKKRLVIIVLTVLMATVFAGWSAPDKAVTLPRYGGWEAHAAVQVHLFHSGLGDKLALPRYGGWANNKLGLPRYGGWMHA
jgi:hypothetical protein